MNWILKHVALNYKPVSLTLVICRTEEHIIHNYTTSHLVEQHLISNVQHRFVKRRSFLTQHFTFLNMLDFSKCLILSPTTSAIVLQNSKINSFILGWIEDYLNKIKQIRVERFLSTLSQVASGDSPQGAV